MPHTYMRTSLPRSGLNSSFSPVSELNILSMDFQPPPDRVRRHELDELRKFRPVRLSGQRDTQRHEKIRAFSAGTLLQPLRERFQIAARLLIGIAGSAEEFRSCGRDHALFLNPQRRE